MPSKLNYNLTDTVHQKKPNYRMALPENYALLAPKINSTVSTMVSLNQNPVSHPASGGGMGKIWDSIVNFFKSLFCCRKSHPPGFPPNIASDDVAGQKQYRVQVMNDTLKLLKAGSYTSPDGDKHTLDLSRAARGANLLLNAGNGGQKPGSDQTRIIVRNQDCLYAAADLHARGLNPIILDMASDGHFGGGYLTGARAQEEDCCRRTGLSHAVDTQHGVQQRNFYPLSQQSPSAGIYVPHVPIFRAGYDQGYQYLDHPFEAAFGIIAGFNSPPLDYSSGEARLRPEEASITREKIRTFFEMARQQGHQSVVFSAFASGAFRNPPKHIAEMTMDVLNNEFAHCFKEVVIAILEDHNTGQATNPEGNFKPFARCAIAAGGQAFDANGQQITVI